MFRKPEKPAQETHRLPELRLSCDRIADHGRILRDRMEALRPYSDLKYWR